MKSAALGSATSAPEVTNVSARGFWLLFDGQDLFLPFDDFPWFKGATIANISHIERLSDDHLYWPDLDIDLAVDSIRHPDRYPLVARRTSARP